MRQASRETGRHCGVTDARQDEPLPRAAAPFLDFARLLRRDGFPVAPEQAAGFMQAVLLLGPRSMEDIRQAALAMLAPPPHRRDAFDAHFRAFFHGEAPVALAGTPDEGTRVKDGSGSSRDQPGERHKEKGGELSSGQERLSARVFRTEDDPLARFRRTLLYAMPVRRSFRDERTRSHGRPDLRRSLKAIVQADGDVPTPRLRRRLDVPRRLLLLIDVSGSMKLHTADYLKLAHAAVQGAASTEVFTLGTRLTRITASLRVRRREEALARCAAAVEDWDGGTRIGPTLLAFLAVPRYSAFARGAAVVLLSDGLERGEPTEMRTAIRRLAARAYRFSLATPLAGDPRFKPETAALRAILPALDDLVDGSSIGGLADFILSLSRPAPAAQKIWRLP